MTTVMTSAYIVQLEVEERNEIFTSPLSKLKEGGNNIRDRRQDGVLCRDCFQIQTVALRRRREAPETQNVKTVPRLREHTACVSLAKLRNFRELRLLPEEYKQ